MEKNVAVVGASGAVGQEIIKVLEKRNFPVKNIKLLASKRSAGKKISFKGEKIEVEELKSTSFKGIDIALFSAGSSVSKEFAKHVVNAGAVMIDNSSAFRLEKDIPLVVPEINPEDIKWHKGIISNPNCSTIIMLVAINPIYKLSRIKRIIASTYQAVSGAGAAAMQECIDQTREVLNGGEIQPIKFPYQIAFNLIPHIDTFQENLYTREEMKMVWETKKILHDEEIKIAATTVRVPVLRSHSESLLVETEKKLTLEEIRNAIDKAPGVILEDDPMNNIYPMPFSRTEKDEVAVGRIRYDLSSETGIMLWAVGDQLLKGAALNAVQIAELLL